MDFGAIVIGAGHNGLICAAYLAKAGISTLVVESRPEVGGQAASEEVLGGAIVNICNCDHTMIRTTGIPEELDLARHGLRYLDTDPAYLSVNANGGPGWFLFHNLERTIDSLGQTYPSEVANYERYARAAIPLAKMITELAQSTPTPGAITKKLLARPATSLQAVPTLMKWANQSVGDVVRSFFDAEQLRAPLMTAGPSVWGLSPEFPKTGLGVLGYAMKHVGQTSRPEGGSGALPKAVASAFVEAGGVLRTNATVTAIVCEGPRVRGVELSNGEVIVAPIVVSAADSHNALVKWLREPPAAAQSMVDRYKAMPVGEGYEAKIDAVIDMRYGWPQVSSALLTKLGLTDDEQFHPTAIVATSLAQMAQDHVKSTQGIVADRPQLLVQMPSVLDPTVKAALPNGHEVFSLEVLWAPWALRGGWSESTEPERWLQFVSTMVEMPDGKPFHEHVVDFRFMGPVQYDARFGMPRGHAQTFAGTPLTAFLGKDPEQTRYETPIKGLYLTGAGTFPGAGVWGASGRNTAHKILSS